MVGGRWQKAVVEAAMMGSCELLLRACRTKGNFNGGSVKTVCGQHSPPFFTFRRSFKGKGGYKFKLRALILRWRYLA